MHSTDAQENQIIYVISDFVKPAQFCPISYMLILASKTSLLTEGEHDM